MFEYQINANVLTCLEILKYLLPLLLPNSAIINHPNAQSNTPLHWTALNHHLSCLQLLISAGADPSLVNKAGHDAVFEAERAISGDEGKEDEKAEKGRKCVEWLLGCQQASGLERGVRGGGGEGEAEAEAEGERDLNGDTSTSAGAENRVEKGEDAMDMSG